MQKGKWGPEVESILNNVQNGEIKAKGKFNELKKNSKSFEEMIKISEKN